MSRRPSWDLKKSLILKALRELSAATDEFTQYDLHWVLSDFIGRDLTPAEKERATKYAKNRATVIRTEDDPVMNTTIYIFVF